MPIKEEVKNKEKQARNRKYKTLIKNQFKKVEVYLKENQKDEKELKNLVSETQRILDKAKNKKQEVPHPLSGGGMKGKIFGFVLLNWLKIILIVHLEKLIPNYELLIVDKRPRELNKGKNKTERREYKKGITEIKATLNEEGLVEPFTPLTPVFPGREPTVIGDHKLEGKLKIESYPNLETVSLLGTEGITELTIENCPNLKELNVAGNKITQIIGLDKCPKLEILNTCVNKIAEIDLSKNTALKALLVSNNTPQTKIKGLEKLSKLVLYNNRGENDGVKDGDEKAHHLPQLSHKKFEFEVEQRDGSKETETSTKIGYKNQLSNFISGSHRPSTAFRLEEISNSTLEGLISTALLWKGRSELDKVGSEVINRVVELLGQTENKEGGDTPTTEIFTLEKAHLNTNLNLLDLIKE
ncbi:1798_t:CDS:2 [Gigaspora margarita]|uniref:1798_t:CDS:1 n=1 Tax=Gigaspora margarita TaxID=4874 RepID=A0ABM8W1P8_GIGMA|nr:1798_t:CDS:2 [Gigaspora margarita]